MSTIKSTADNGAFTAEEIDELLSPRELEPGQRPMGDIINSMNIDFVNKQLENNRCQRSILKEDRKELLRAKKRFLDQRPIAKDQSKETI